MSEQRWLARQWGKEGVVLYRGPDALAWENLDENKCVKPGCNLHNLPIELDGLRDKAYI